MSDSTLSVRRNGAIMHVAINNPPVNLLSIRMVKDLFGLVGQLNSDPSVKVVVFESAVPDFLLAHFDLDDMIASMEDPSGSGKYPDINILQSLALSIQALPQVTIAKVDGACRGGGLELVMGMTMRFASERSRFCAPEANGGFLACGGGSTRFALACGPARALEIMLSARDFSGKEAQDYGLINRALPTTEELDAYVQTLAERIAARTRHVIAVNRETVKRALSFAVEPMFGGFAYENDAMRACRQRPEFIEGFKAAHALGQSREVELDLPASMDAALGPLRKNWD